jgi:threonine/homoserine/homoserine lactone efflux protein
MATLDEYPEIFLILKITGSAYVFWIAWKIFKTGVLEGRETAKPVNFMDGMILLVVNPKAYVIIALMFTQFLVPSETDRLLAVLLITTIFTLNNFVAFSIWALVGDKIASRFRSPGSAKKLNMIFGLILALVAVWMLL